MTRLLTAALAAALLAGCAPERPADVDDAKVALLRIHRDDIRAHREGDVDALLATVGAEGLLLAGDGGVFRQSRDDVRAFFTDYLDGARYGRYEDLMVPHAEVSDDGTMGWVMSRQAVERTEPDPAGGRRSRAFTYAGVMIYANRGQGWKKVANVSTFAPDLDDAELTGLADEALRARSAAPHDVVRTPAQRRERVLQLLAEGRVRTARDRYRAAAVLAGAEAAETRALARALAARALAGGVAEAGELVEEGAPR